MAPPEAPGRATQLEMPLLLCVSVTSHSEWMSKWRCVDALMSQQQGAFYPRFIAVPQQRLPQVSIIVKTNKPV